MADLSTVVDDLQRAAAEDSQAARWDMDDCRSYEYRLTDALDDEHREYLTQRLAQLRESAAARQARSARCYAQARRILGID